MPSAETTPSRYAALSREQLATLLPELLLIGQLIDRSGMAWCIQAFGREEMLQVAIEEWAGASPIYTRRMQRALGYEGDDVLTIIKGLQLDIGAPPQFMDFRYTIHDRWSADFHLDHCGALMDVEPMGEDYVRGMCHDIEDPTFDATAVASNPRAQIRPIHRPPRTPVDRTPHCAWTIRIDPGFPEVEHLDPYFTVVRSQAASLTLGEIDPEDEGQCDYSGPVLSDLDFAAFSHSALVRMVDEVCLQMHLLVLSFTLAVEKRAETPEQAREIRLKQLIGIAGLAAERINRCLDLPGDEQGAVQTLWLHPLLNPSAYVAAQRTGSTVSLGLGASRLDGTWVELCGPDELRPLQAAVQAVDPYLDIEAVAAGDGEWAFAVVRGTERATESGEVAVTRFSSGAGFAFSPRRSLPITPV